MFGWQGGRRKAKIEGLAVSSFVFDVASLERAKQEYLPRGRGVLTLAKQFFLAIFIYLGFCATPILTALPLEETSLTDILVRKLSPSSASVNPKVLLELFSMYRDWQEAKIQTISKKQEELENKIEVADALAVKLLQRFNYSVSTMQTTSNHLSEVHALQVGLGELKGRLTEVISNCDSLCKRITAEGPESLRSSVKPFSVTTADLETSCSSHSLERVLNRSPSTTESKLD